MRYLRLLLNSVLAGGIAAAYLTTLFLQLNPAAPLEPRTVAPLLLVLLLSYGIHLAVASYVVMVLWQMFASARLSPAWVSVRVLAWLGALVASGGAALMWLNLASLRSSLASGAAQRMALGAAVLTVCAVVFLLLALVRHSVRPQRWRLGAALFVAALMASVVAPLAIRGGAIEPPRAGRGPSAGRGPAFAASPGGGRVVMLLVDGASLDYISPAAAEGRLPNFGRILDAGAVMHLATLRPTQPEPVWTAVATGRLPSQTGVRSNASYQVGPAGPVLDLLPDYCLAQVLVHFGFLREARHTSEAVRTRTLWDILGASGLASAVVRWPLTFPARPVPGIVVSERLHLAAGATLQLNGSPLAAPIDAAERLQAALSPSAVAPVIGGLAEGSYPAIGSLALDRFYADVLRIVSDTPDVRFVAMRYQGLDAAGHYYLRRAVPRAFGGAAAADRRDAARTLEQYYRYIDEQVGEAVERLAPEDLLLVVSGFGMEPMRLPKRLLERVLGTRELSGTHERAPDGFLMAYGAAVRPGRLPRASVVDVAPTVLYFFGLPIGRDMDGFARTDVFARAFTDERPLTFIPTYER